MMRWSKAVLLAGAACTLGLTPLLAQDAPVAADERDEEARRVIKQIKATEELALSGRGGYNYDPAGRPDPFVDPFTETTGNEQGPARPPGWPGMLINEVRLQGITVFDMEPIAMFLGTDGVGYFAREGDELWDGKIEMIDFETQMIVFKQKVEDPSSPVRHRKVERQLHP